ncbi:MAG: 2Fe-2S iron-sulfur cluster binding domain-containing protein [Bacteroidetes bacterium]|jgi:ring-1,2-phenylacetyl-CoA epoxidase subunit PaaE|nr:2Fe-2S iron-sulfur cluster binding domain-containing protein [Bacteroidota bacterium]
MARFHTLKVKDIRRETADAVSIAFDIPLAIQHEYQFKQGQYITVKLTVNGEELRRSYSICTSPYSEKELRVAVKEVQDGRASTLMNRTWKVGDAVEVMTPMGNFSSILSGNNKKHYVLFAGGSGITPMMSILKSVLYIEKQSNVTLVYANRDEDSVIFKTEIEKIVSENADRVKVLNVYDNPKTQVSDLQKGLLSVDRVKAIVENYGGVNADEYFICGPGPMMENIKQGLEDLKIAKEKVHIEYFSAVADAVAKAEGNAVTGADVNSEVTVIQYGIETTMKLNTAGLTILDAAIDAGVDAPFSCKGAVCCTCRAKVIEGKAKMDANFALTDAEVEDGFILTCQAHPLTEKLIVDFDAI